MARSRDAGIGVPVEVARGVWQILLPTPWPVGAVAVHLIEDDPLTLVDAGPQMGAARDALERGLAARGRRIADLERIVLTHHHLDHAGGAGELVARSGAELAALAPIAGWLATYERSSVADELYAERLLRRHGMAEPEIAAVSAHERRARAFGGPARVDRRLREGDELTLRDRRLRVLCRPGHSPTDTVLLDEGDGVLFGGDHLMRAFASQPVCAPMPPPGGEGPGERALGALIASLRRTAEIAGLRRVLPGHGPPVDAPRELIVRRLRGYDEQTAALRDRLRDGPVTAVDVAREIKGPRPSELAYFAVCEMLGHLLRLADAGDARAQRDADGVVRFSATG